MRQALLAAGAALVLAATVFMTSSAEARSGGGMGGGAATMGGIGGPPRGPAMPAAKGGKGGKGNPASHAGTDKGRGGVHVNRGGPSRDARARSGHHAKSHGGHHPISHRHFRNGGAFTLALTPPYFAGYPYDHCHEWTQVRTPFGVRGMWVDVCDY